jgi:nucleoside-diphosphate-sugar epimerase
MPFGGSDWHEGDARGVFNLGSGEETTLNRLARSVLDLHAGAGATLVSAAPGEHDGVRFCMDITRVRECFGFEPEFSLDRGLAAYSASSPTPKSFRAGTRR